MNNREVLQVTNAISKPSFTTTLLIGTVYLIVTVPWVWFFIPPGLDIWAYGVLLFVQSLWTGFLVLKSANHFAKVGFRLAELSAEDIMEAIKDAR